MGLGRIKKIKDDCTGYFKLDKNDHLYMVYRIKFDFLFFGFFTLKNVG